jgi:hypothetical protein
VFEERMLRRIFGLKGDEVTGGLRKLHNELSHVDFTPSIIRMIKSKRMRWAGHLERKGEKRLGDGLLMGKPKGWRPLGILRRRWWIILRWIFQRYDGVAWTGLFGLQ